MEVGVGVMKKMKMKIVRDCQVVARVGQKKRRRTRRVRRVMRVREAVSLLMLLI